VCCMCFRYMHICIGRITDDPTLNEKLYQEFEMNQDEDGNRII
jgi:hypothetical protein